MITTTTSSNSRFTLSSGSDLVNKRAPGWDLLCNYFVRLKLALNPENPCLCEAAPDWVALYAFAGRWAQAHCSTVQRKLPLTLKGCYRQHHVSLWRAGHG